MAGGQNESLETLIGRLSATLVEKKPTELDEGINEALRLIAEFTNTVRSSVFLLDVTSDVVTNTHEWCADPGDSQIAQLQGIPFSTFGYYRELLVQHRDVVIGKLDDLPAEAEGERAWIKQYGFRPLLFVPMLVGGQLQGALGFYGKSGEERDWPPGHVPVLRAAALFINSVLVRKRAELSQAVSEEQLRRLVDQAPLSIQVYTPDGTLIHANAGWAKLWKVEDPRAVIGSYNILKDQRASDAGHDLLFQKAAGGDAIDIKDVSHASEGEEPTVTNLRMFPLLDPDRKTSSVVVLHEDITDRRALEDQLNQSRRLEAVGRLAGGVAHDFNNNLTGILGAADLLSKKQLGDEAGTFVGIIGEAARRSSDLVGQLLAFSRHTPRRHVNLDLNERVEAVLRLFRPSFGEGELISELGAAPSTVMGDTSQLENAILNLLLNANDAIDAGGTVRVRTGNVALDGHQAKALSVSDGDYVFVEVQDDGVGMEAETARRVFDPYFTRGRTGKGTGLGLAAAHGTAHGHGGSISVRSAPGQGSCFTMVLPLRAGRAGTDTLPPRSAAARRPGCVLVVEDQELVRRTLVSMLESQNIEAVAAEDGHQAIQIFSKEPRRYDAALIDLVMPGFSGDVCFRELRAIRNDLPALICSGYDSETGSERILDAGRASYLPKPFNAQKLVEALEDLMATAAQ